MSILCFVLVTLNCILKIAPGPYWLLSRLGQMGAGSKFNCHRPHGPHMGFDPWPTYLLTSWHAKPYFLLNISVIFSPLLGYRLSTTIHLEILVPSHLHQLLPALPYSLGFSIKVSAPCVLRTAMLPLALGCPGWHKGSWPCGLASVEPQLSPHSIVRQKNINWFSVTKVWKIG